MELLYNPSVQVMEFRDFLDKICVIDPAKRISLNQCLTHPFIQVTDHSFSTVSSLSLPLTPSSSLPPASSLLPPPSLPGFPLAPIIWTLHLYRYFS